MLRVCRCQTLNATRRGMQPHLEGIEIRFATNDDAELTIKNSAFQLHSADSLGDLRKVSLERLAGFPLQLDRGTVFESQASEPVPFRLEQPTAVRWQLAYRFGLHRQQGCSDWRLSHTVYAMNALISLASDTSAFL